MDKFHLTQEGLANLAKVSQSTVSRALSGARLRRGAARGRLFKYAGIVDTVDMPRKGIKAVIHAFEKIWDGSPTHADAVADVIISLAKLRPAKPKGKTTP